LPSGPEGGDVGRVGSGRVRDRRSRLDDEFALPVAGECGQVVVVVAELAGVDVGGDLVVGGERIYDLGLLVGHAMSGVDGALGNEIVEPLHGLRDADERTVLVGSRSTEKAIFISD